MKTTLAGIGFCTVKSLLKNTQLFIHNEPFTLHDITSSGVPQMTNNKQSKVNGKGCQLSSLGIALHD
jgi:hypothetical protein